MMAEPKLSLIRIFLFSFLMLIYVSLPQFVQALIPSDPVMTDVATTLTFFLVLMLMYGTVVFFQRWEGKIASKDVWLHFDSESIPQLLVGALAGGLAAFVVVLFALVLGGDLRPVSEITPELITNEVIITAPIAFVEELCYRGYMLSRMDRLWGRPIAIIASSGIFSLLHFNWWLPLGVVPIHLILIFTCNIFLGGVVLSASYYLSSQRLWTPIAFHFMWNILAYILFPLYPRVQVKTPEIFQIEWGITTIPAFLFGLSLLYLLVSYTKRKECSGR